MSSTNKTPVVDKQDCKWLGNRLLSTDAWDKIWKCHSLHRSSLARTIMQEDVAEFLRLVQEGASVWEFDDHGWTPLHWACSRGSTVLTYAILQEVRSSQEAGGPMDRYCRIGYNAHETLASWGQISTVSPIGLRCWTEKGCHRCPNRRAHRTCLV